MTTFELQKLRDLPIEGVAERLGLRVERHKCLCPFHDDHTPSLSFKNNKFRCWSCGESGDSIFHDDHTPSLSFKNNKFRCWSCGESGDSISLAEKMLGKGFVEACRWLADEHNVILTEYKSSETKPPVPFDSKRYERFFSSPWLSPAARQFLFDERTDSTPSATAKARTGSKSPTTTAQASSSACRTAT